MNESAEYTRLLAQAYSKLADDYSAMTQREDAARAEIHRLEELLEKWMAEATRQSERADSAEDRLRDVIKAGDAMAKSAGYVSPPLEWTAARQQGGAK